MTAADGAAWEFVKEIYITRKAAKQFAENRTVPEIAEFLRTQNFHGAPPKDYAAAMEAHLPQIYKSLGQDAPSVTISGWYAHHHRPTNTLEWYTTEAQT